MFVSERQHKETICEIGRRVYQRGFAAANDGNISIRLNEKEILCTPTGVSKGYMKPDDLCVVDPDGKQLRGQKRRTSEILLHLAVYRENPKIGGVVHCHPPHATAFAIAHEPIPKCVLPEVEVFLGEVPIAEYETPGTQKFAETIRPYIKDSNTIILANHGTVAFAEKLETAYFNTEIIDAYCKMLILAKQLGRINYFSPQQTQELLDMKKRLGIDDPRLRSGHNCDMCGNSIFREGYSDFKIEPHAFVPPAEHVAIQQACMHKLNGSSAPKKASGEVDIEKLVKTITEQVMAALNA